MNFKKHIAVQILLKRRASVFWKSETQKYTGRNDGEKKCHSA